MLNLFQLACGLPMYMDIGILTRTVTKLLENMSATLNYVSWSKGGLESSASREIALFNIATLLMDQLN